MKRTVEVVLLLYIAGLWCVDVSAQQAVPSGSNTEVPKGNAVLVSLFKPVYPQLARQANVWGDVKVAVTVRPDGTAGVALESGHPMLRQAALDSAARSHFECPMCGHPVSYMLVYTFKQIEGHGCCSAISAPVTVEQKPQRTDQQGRPQSHITIAAEHVCLCDPPSTLTMKVRSIKCLYLWKCSVR
ncbi:MAG: energy transducer TonB [Acidobacteriia bacterium]|nr:energy transducer TonB [Terriglobia bacterium]